MTRPYTRGIHRYTTDNGLVGNNLTSITVGGDGTVWLGSFESSLVGFQAK